jgi:hypothetical protein
MDAEKILATSVESLGKARVSLVVLLKRWHRDNEDKAIRYAIEQIDLAGMGLCELQGLGGGDESARPGSHSGIPQVY